MDTTSGGILSAFRKHWFRVRLAKSTSPFFIRAVLTLFLVGGALQFFR
jgi:hypothetical protein